MAHMVTPDGRETPSLHSAFVYNASMPRGLTRTFGFVTVLAGTAAIVAAAPLRQDMPIHWSASIGVPADAAAKPLTAGTTIPVVLSAQIDAGWHLYGLVEPPGPIATAISIPKGQPFSIDGEIDVPPPEREFDQNFGAETAFYETQTSFTVPVRIAAGLSGPQTLTVAVTFQTCNGRFCLPPTSQKLALAMTIGAPASSTRMVAPAASDAAPSPAASATRAHVPDMSSATSASTLGAYVGLAALMGALSLLTPCVFPMVPITVTFFTNRVSSGGASRGRRDAVQQALLYGAGIVLTFTAVGFVIAVSFGASGLNRFAADPWLNLGVTALFVIFALSLFGVYELALPSSLLTAVSKSSSGAGRHVGTLLMGFAFTLTSFTCTAPFLGTLLVLAGQGQWQWPLAGMLAFSSVFALPFVLLAWAPQLIGSLPRAGGWLSSVKATMGLLELAAAFKFLSNVDLVWHWNVFTRTNVLVAWIVIAVVLVAYLLGAFRLGHAPKLSRPGLARFATVAITVLAVAWLGRGISGQRLGELEAFLPPADLSGHGTNGELDWILNDYDAGLARATREHRPMLVDFTGYTCTNCRWMEANMFPRPDVTRELAQYVRVRLYTDGQGAVYERAQAFEQRLFGTVALPYYAVFTPTGAPVVAFGGLTRNSDEYLAFLRKGLE
jgi:thiol:disulfide interchange protein DsbD